MKSTVLRRLTPIAFASVALLGAGLLSPSIAQNSSSALASSPLATRTQKRIASLFHSAGQGAQSLNLSAAQKAKLKMIAQKNAPLAKTIWSDNSLSKAQKMGKIRGLQNEASAVFTPAQKQKIASAKTTAMLQLFQTASWVSDELQLTAPQQEKIQAVVFKSYRQGRNAVGDFGALRSLIVDANGQIDATLTPAQRAKWSVIQRAARSEFAKNARSLRAMSGV